MRNKIIIGILLIALISSIFWNYKNFGRPLDTGSDELKYDEIAVNILEKYSFTYQGKETFIEPLYPLFLAGIYSIFGHNYDAVRIIQIILFVLSVILIYFLTKDLFNQKMAVISSLGMALFYGLVSPAGRLHRETFFNFLIVLLIYALYRTHLKRGRWWFIFSGVILGLATLTNGIVQFLFLIIFVNFLIIYRKNLFNKKLILNIFLFLISFLIILSPWLIKNYSQFSTISIIPRKGKFLMVRAELMEKLYKNYPTHLTGHALGYYFAEKIDPRIDVRAFREWPQTEKKIQQLLQAGYDYYEIDRILTSQGISKILANPHKFLATSFLGFLLFNNPLIFVPQDFNNVSIWHMFAENRHPELPNWVKTSIILAIRFIWLIFFVFIVYAIVKNIKHWHKFSWIFLVILYFNVTYSALHAIPRYALPIYPFYIILFTKGLSIFINKRFLKDSI